MLRIFSAKIDSRPHVTYQYKVMLNKPSRFSYLLILTEAVYEDPQQQTWLKRPLPSCTAVCRPLIITPTRSGVHRNRPPPPTISMSSSIPFIVMSVMLIHEY